MKTLAHRILLVDDDLDEQFLTGRALKKAMSNRSSLHIVSSGNEAIAYMIGEGKFEDRIRFPFPTIVIADLNMVDGDGFAVLEFMQANPEWSVVPRIMHSTSDEPDDVRTAYFLGVSVYHKKQMGPANLERQMNQILKYWAASEVPPVDESGRLLVTSSIGRMGERYPQLIGGALMRRPGRPSKRWSQPDTYTNRDEGQGEAGRPNPNRRR